ncbi:MAG: hypothetical protein Q8O29_11905 [Polaromonas sp.]|uniref:hypothetical protein n=1 Tax=Polaromonas sp. TaxID=1869339 RepID=UPI002735900D|nr:hypothetical protein [Polaromonas sp.]MDP2818952.1 hypothetical protein [Polaromonas sp.]
MATAKKPPVSRKQSSAGAKKAALKKPAAAPAPVQPAGTAKTARTNPKAKKPIAKPVSAPKTEKPVKAKKPKLVRDSFTIPKPEYVVLEALKQRAAGLAHPVKKSELLRAGIKTLAAMPDAAFLTALNNVPTIKTGRPAA